MKFTISKQIVIQAGLHCIKEKNLFTKVKEKLTTVIKHHQDTNAEIEHIKSALGKEAQNLPTELLNDIIAKMV